MDELLKLLQEYLRRNPIVIVGTGLSMSMGVSGMSGLLARLESNVPPRCKGDRQMSDEWGRARDLIRKYGFEEGLSKQALDEKLLAIIVEETATLIERDDESLRLKIATDSTFTFPFASLIAHLFKSLSPSAPTLNIITSNYDHIVEYACDKMGIKCSTGFVGSIIQKFDLRGLDTNLFQQVEITRGHRVKKDFRQEGRIRLFKPHGSIWWRKGTFGTFQSSRPIPGSQVAIITPGLAKYKKSLTDDVMNAHRERASDCIRKAASAIIIGYGFNDDHLQTSLLARLADGMDCLVLTKSLTAKARSVVHKYPQVLALEQRSGGTTRWFYKGNEHEVVESLWDLSTLVKKLI